MDITTLIGVIGGVGCILFAIFQGSGLATFVHIPSLLITVGGTFAATLINFPMAEILKISNAAIKVLKSPNFDAARPIPDLITFAEKARQGGLLSLENEIENIDDEFLVMGLNLVIDGTSPNDVRDIMETEIDYMLERHRKGQQLFLAMAKYSPGFGMIGTLIGLIAMLKTMNDPSTIGPSMSVALMTTFYGALMANLVCMPIAGKLKARTSDELLMRNIIMEGIIMIQAQSNPRFVAKVLVSYLPPKQREAVLNAEARGGEVASEEATSTA
ncbi:motility protein A [Candidatus Poribacteria bacterium]|nr:motility protein A [Candidatus Poribacteria bacterium]